MASPRRVGSDASDSGRRDKVFAGRRFKRDRPRSLSDGNFGSLTSKPQQHAWEDDMESLLVHMFRNTAMGASDSGPRQVNTHLRNAGWSVGALAGGGDSVSPSGTDEAVRGGSCFAVDGREGQPLSETPECSRTDARAQDASTSQIQVVDSLGASVDKIGNDSCKSATPGSPRRPATASAAASATAGIEATNGSIATLDGSVHGRRADCDRGTAPLSSAAHDGPIARHVLRDRVLCDKPNVEALLLLSARSAGTPPVAPTSPSALEKQKQSLVALSVEKNMDLNMGAGSTMPPGLHSHLRKAFTIFHNKQSDSADTGVAYLGDEKSIRSGDLFFKAKLSHQATSRAVRRKNPVVVGAPSGVVGSSPESEAAAAASAEPSAAGIECAFELRNSNSAHSDSSGTGCSQSSSIASVRAQASASLDGHELGRQHHGGDASGGVRVQVLGAGSRGAVAEPPVNLTGGNGNFQQACTGVTSAPMAMAVRRSTNDAGTTIGNDTTGHSACIFESALDRYAVGSAPATTFPGAMAAAYDHGVEEATGVRSPLHQVYYARQTDDVIDDCDNDDDDDDDDDGDEFMSPDDEMECFSEEGEEDEDDDEEASLAHDDHDAAHGGGEPCTGTDISSNISRVKKTNNPATQDSDDTWLPPTPIVVPPPVIPAASRCTTSCRVPDERSVAAAAVVGQQKTESPESPTSPSPIQQQQQHSSSASPLSHRRPSIVRGPAGCKPLASRLRVPGRRGSGGSSSSISATTNARTFNNNMNRFAMFDGRARAGSYSAAGCDTSADAETSAAARGDSSTYVPVLPPLPPVGLAPDEVNSWLLPHVIARASVQARATAKAVLRGLVHRPDRQVYRVLGKRSSSSDVLSVLARQTKAAAAATSKSRKHHRSAPNDSEDGSESVLEHHKQAPPDADADADADPGSSSSSSGADSPVTISPTATAANQVLPPPKRRPASGSLPGSPTTSLHFQSGSSATRWAPLPANPTKSVPWVPRWFVVRHNFVFEFASRDDLLPVGCSPLSDAIVHHWPRPHRDSFTLELHVDPKFASSSVGRLFLDIRCTSQREMAAMTSSLERASLMGHDDLYDISSDRLPLGSGRFARVLDVTRKSRAQQKTQAGHHTSDAENSDNKQNNLNDVPAGPPSRDEDVTSRQAQSGEVGDGAVRQERCAIKLIDKRRFWALVHSGKERADTLLREITTQAMLTVVATQMPYLVGAEGIVQLRDVFETKSHIALEVELMEGGDLFHLLDMRVALKEPEAANVVAQVLRALVLLNRHHVAHRDIKLTNLIFDRPPLAPSPSSPPTGDDEQEATGTSSSPADDVADDLDKTERSGTNAGMNSNSTPEPPQGRLRLKLADFGMATFEQGSGGLLHGRCGTPGYVAPEILRAKPLEGYPNTVDMFSTGVVAYTLLCGYEPFYGSTERQLIAANKRCEFAFHLPEWGSISAEAKDFVERLMEPDPAKRPTAAQALQHKWIALHVTPQESEAQKKRRFKRHKKSIAAKAAAAAAVAATNLKDGNETNAARQVVDAAVLAQHHNLSPSSRDARQQQRRRRRRRSSDVKASVVKTRVVNDRGDMLCVVS